MSPEQTTQAIKLIQAVILTEEQEMHLRELVGGSMMFTHRVRQVFLEIAEIAYAGQLRELSGYLVMQAAWIKVQLDKVA